MTVTEIIQLLGVGTFLALGLGLGITLLRWLWVRTGRAPTLTAGELEELRARLAELEMERGRVAELEERIDFAERMLARQAEIEKLPEGR